MGYKRDLTGQRFGNLVVVRFSHTDGKRKNWWTCKCDCGKEKSVIQYSLVSGATRSCGCSKGLYKIKTMKTHGKSRERIYNIWRKMKGRCYNLSDTNYDTYGAKGIKVCDEWRDSFQSFYDWSIQHGYKDNLTIDRIKTNGNYCPENCRWITMSAQQDNKNNALRVVYCGEIRSIKELSELSGIKYATIFRRIRMGYHEELWLFKGNFVKHRKVLAQMSSGSIQIPGVKFVMEETIAARAI